MALLMQRNIFQEFRNQRYHHKTNHLIYFMYYIIHILYICRVEKIFRLSMKKGEIEDLGKKQGGQRQLKVYPKYFERSFRGVVFPEIRLCGKWLQDMGFTCGQTITIKHEKNKIIIESKPNENIKRNK